MFGAIVRSSTPVRRSAQQLPSPTTSSDSSIDSYYPPPLSPSSPTRLPLSGHRLRSKSTAIPPILVPPRSHAPPAPSTPHRPRPASTVYVEIPPSPWSRTPTTASIGSGRSLASQLPKLDALLSTPSSGRFWPDNDTLTFNLVPQSRTLTATSTPAPAPRHPTQGTVTPRRGMGIAYHELSRGTPLSRALRAIRAVRDYQSRVSAKTDLRAPWTVEQAPSSSAWVSVQAKAIGRPATQTASTARRLRRKAPRRVLGSIYRESPEPALSHSHRVRSKKRTRAGASSDATSRSKIRSRAKPAPKREKHRSFTQELAHIPPQLLEQKLGYGGGENRAKFIESAKENEMLDLLGDWPSEHLRE